MFHYSIRNKYLDVEQEIIKIIHKDCSIDKLIGIYNSMIRIKKEEPSLNHIMYALSKNELLLSMNNSISNKKEYYINIPWYKKITCHLINWNISK